MENIYEWNGATFESREEMETYKHDTKVSSQIIEVYDKLFDITNQFYSVKKEHKEIASNLLRVIYDNYDSVKRFYDVHHIVNRLIGIL